MPENDRLLEAIKEYFNEYFDDFEKRLEAIEKKLNEVLGQNEDLKESVENNNIILQSVHKGGMTFLLRLDSIQKYIQQLARLNCWKLPEKQKPPVPE